MMPIILRISCCALLLTLVLGHLAAPAHGQNIYVHPRNVSGVVDGTLEHPYTTLASALAAAPAGSTLVLQGYQYEDPFTITYPEAEVGSLPLIINKNLKVTTHDGT